MNARVTRFAAVVATLLLTAVAAGPVLSGSQARPFAGERHLTADDEALALRDMPRGERLELQPLFEDDTKLIVGYARRIIGFQRLPDGSLRAEQIGVLNREGDPLDIPSLGQAVVTDTYTPGTTLYQSLTVYRTCSTCLQWNIRHYYDWQGSPIGGNNGNRDRIGIAWGGDLAPKTGSYYMTGKYTNGAGITPFDQFVDAEDGVGWSFREWYSPNTPLRHVYANWGRGYASIVESRFQNRLTNVVAGYAHTGLSTTGGSISFGPASISFNGTDDFEWKFSVQITT